MKERSKAESQSAYLNVKVPAALHRGFKLSCLLRGRSMQAQIVELMKAWALHHEDAPFIKEAFVTALETARPERAAKERKA